MKIDMFDLSVEPEFECKHCGRGPRQHHAKWKSCPTVGLAISLIGARRKLMWPLVLKLRLQRKEVSREGAN